MNELTDETQFYRAMHRLTEIAWERRMTIEALLALAELLGEPPTNDGSMTRAVER